MEEWIRPHRATYRNGRPSPMTLEICMYPIPIAELLGSWAVAADQGQGSKQLHVVYASPGTIAAYRTDGRFPDGAVLVKEVFKAATGQMTTGTVSHAETL